MTPREKVSAILTSLGAVLVRHRKHEVYRLPDGRIWTRSKTPSVSHSDLNNLADLKREFGISERRRKNPNRKEKQPNHGGHGKRKDYIPAGDSPLAHELRVTGLLEQRMREEIADLRNQLEQMTDSRDRWKTLYCRLKSETDGSWVWRIRCWWKGSREGK